MEFKSIKNSENIYLKNIYGHNDYDKYYSYLYVSKLSSKEDIFLQRSLLGEGNTPIVKSKQFGNLFFKNEGTNPTGSFKDRETSFVFSILKENNLVNGKDILITSSGNAAISAILYGNYFDKKVHVFVSKNISSHKLEILMRLGAKIEIFGDDYEETYRYVIDNFDNENYINVTAGALEWRDEANKKISYELYNQGIHNIDYIIIPIGNGSLFRGIYKGFMEIFKKGLIEKIPYMIGVQVKNASPIEKALERKKEFYIVGKDKMIDSIADGIVARESYCAPKVINIINQGFGEIISVNESEIKTGYEMFLKEGLLTEYTSAVVYSAYLKDIKRFENSKVVAVISGNGQKNL